MRRFGSNIPRSLMALASSALLVFGTLAPTAAEAVSCETSLAVDGDYTVVSFNTVGDCLWTVPAGVESVEYLIVGAGGGGGGGGARAYSCIPTGTPAGVPRTGGGGAGGGGGAVVSGELVVSAGMQVAVTVGAGGVGGLGGTCPFNGTATAGNAGGDGGHSAFDESTAAGGTGGDGAPDTGAGAANGGDSGANSSYFGGTQTDSAVDCPPEATTACFAAPGGAGAGGDGFDPALPEGQTDAIFTAGGAGGPGLDWHGFTYGGGGGGGNRHCASYPFAANRSGGTGGIGGGGDGALTPCATGPANGVAGVDNLGGGGGGGRGNGATAANVSNAGRGGDGGDGKVIARYLTPPSNSSTLVSYEVTPTEIESGESVTFLVNDSDTVAQTFYGCVEDTVDGEGDGPVPAANPIAGGAFAYSNDSAQPQLHERKLWLAAVSNVPADCSWVSGEPDFELQWTVNSAPVELTGGVSGVTKDSAKLDWEASNSAGVTSYNVYVNGLLVGSLAADATSHKLTGLKGNTQYLVEVRPVTAAGEATGFSAGFHTRRVIKLRVEFKGNRYRLLSFAQKRLQRAVDLVEPGAADIRVTVIGRVKKVGARISLRDHELAAARAQVVKSRLVKFGLKASWQLSSNPYGSKSEDDWRRTDIVISYAPPLQLD